MRKNRLCIQCNEKITVVRRIKKRGISTSKLKVFSDNMHDLCGRCNDSLRESIKQKQLYS